VLPGIQEFIEAYTFYTYLKEDRIPTLNSVQERLTYPDGDDDSAVIIIGNASKVFFYIWPRREVSKLTASPYER